MNLSRRIALFALLFSILLLSTIWLVNRPHTLEDTSLEYTVIADNLEIPWSIAITAEGEIFVTERTGKVGLIIDGEFTTIYRLEVYHENTEGGLLGMTLHPDYEENHHLYLYYTYRIQETIWNKVMQYTYRNQELVDEKTIIDKIPGGKFHDGGRIKFGPDDKLYITTGETGNAVLAQSLDSLAGKILRLNPDGSIPDDNPISGSPIYSLGHRNSQGITWHPDTGELYSTEHGPSGEGLEFAHDEINLIKPLSNYGWPIIVGMGEDDEYTNPIYQTGDETWAPSGATFLDKMDSSWHARLFVACLRGNGIHMIELSGPQYYEVKSIVKIFGDVGRVRTVVQGPDGYLYFCTSNRDGRGIPRESDDILARFKPPD